MPTRRPDDQSPTGDAPDESSGRGFSRRAFLERSTGLLAAGAVGAVPGTIFGPASGVASAEPTAPPPTPAPDLPPMSPSSVVRSQLLRDGSFEHAELGSDENLETDHDWFVQLTGDPTGGTFTLTVHRDGAETTAPIPYNASAAEVQDALAALDLLDAVGVDVSEHAGGWCVTFEHPKNVPSLTGDGSDLTGGTDPDLRTDRLNVWSESDGPIVIVEHGSHGARSAAFVAAGMGERVWRGPFVPCLPPDVVSFGADNRITSGDAAWTIGLTYFTRQFEEIAGSQQMIASHTGPVWQRRTGVVQAAPAGVAWAAFRIVRPAAAVNLDTLELDAVLVAKGAYTGPMLPAITIAGDVRPNGLLLSAYAGRGCNSLRARVFLDGVEVSESPEETVEPYGWGFTQLSELDPATSYRVQMEARNKSSGLWEAFGDEMSVRTAPPEGVPSVFSVGLLGCAFSFGDRTTWDHVLAHVTSTGRRIDYMNWGGDWHYADRETSNESEHRELFESAWYQLPGLRELLQIAPLIADQLSDHDGGEGGNNKDSFDSDSVRACQAAVRQMIPMPSSTPVDGCRFSTTLIGRVLFISLDTRSVYRSPMENLGGPDKTLLGLPQRTAFFEALDDADDLGYLVLIQSDMIWDIDEAIGNKQDWWNTYSYERDLVAAKITNRRVIMCDYDLHALRIKDVSQWGGVPVIGSAGSVANTNVRGAAEDYYDQLWPKTDKGTDWPTRHWQELVITDDGSTITVQANGYDPRFSNPKKTEATFSFDAPLVEN